MFLLESLPTAIGAAAIAPALLLLWLVIAAEERPGPPLQVWIAFLLGAASISLLGLARAPFMSLLTISDSPKLALALRAIFGVAAPEEIVKVLVIVAVSWRRRRFADPMETVVYGAAAGLGFAAYENLAYLVQHPEMWRSLAVLRSVLTVPFHGALGIIAGAYLAIARSGTALGAHRGHRDRARFTARISILLVPLLLHSIFDIPLLTLQQSPDLEGLTRLALECTSMLIGFGTIAFAVRLVRRVGRHHAPRTELSRERLSHLRRMWALLVAGGGAGFAGVAFVFSTIHHWVVSPERNVTLALIPLGFVSILIGIALLAITTAVYFLSRHRLRTTDSGLPASGRG